MVYAVTRLRVSLADIDPTSFVYYGHYLRYNERAANELCVSDCSAVLINVMLSKYIRGAKWDEEVEIRTRLLDADEATATTGVLSLLHEWFVDGKIIHVSIATYAMKRCPPGCSVIKEAVTGDGDRAVGPSSEHDLPNVGTSSERISLGTGSTYGWQQSFRDTVRIRALQKEAMLTLEYPDLNVRRDEFVVYPDMISEYGTLCTHTVMDLMERQRTTLIGGQEALKRLGERGVTIVCYSIQGLALSHVSVRARQRIEATSRFVVLSDRFYCMHQALHLPTGEVVSECAAFFRTHTIYSMPTTPRHLLHAIYSTPALFRSRAAAVTP